jgi:hypothetical protein
MARRVPGSIREIQKMNIADEEILYLVEEMGRLHQERQAGDVGWYSAVGILADRYGTNSHSRCFCILQRMESFQALLGDERMRGWTVPGIEDGSMFTKAAIFRAVARCPLLADSKRTWFDPDEFFRIALRETESEGTA